MGYAVIAIFLISFFVGCGSKSSVEVIQSPTSAPSAFTQELEEEATQEDSIRLEDIPTTPQEQIIKIQ